MPYTEARNEQFAALARERVVVGDLFVHAVVVVPIKTKRRWYGSISRAVVEKGIKLPELALACAEAQVHGDRTYVFVALWNDENTYAAPLIYNCTRACLRLAARGGIEKIAFPFLGGNQGRKFLGAMEQAVDDAMDECDELEVAMPEVVFVTNQELA